MTMASLSASLLARRGGARAAVRDDLEDHFIKENAPSRLPDPVYRLACASSGQAQTTKQETPQPSDCSSGDSQIEQTPPPRLAVFEAQRQPQLKSAEAAAPASKVAAGSSTDPSFGPSKCSARKAKTLRLDLATDRILRATAARLGVTQQSLMEKGLKSVLKSVSPPRGATANTPRTGSKEP